MEQEIKPWNPKGGRPKKNEKDLRKERLNLKFTEAEMKQLVEECKELGWGKPYVYFRNKLLSKGGAGYNPRELFKALNQINPQLSKAGNNINQVAKYVNYLDKNNMIDAKFIAEYNVHFKRMIEVQREYVLAIRAYLKTLPDE